MRASLGLRWWDEFGADLRYGLCILRKSPGFTAIAAISLALAIGANTTIFSLAKSVLYDRLGVLHAEQLRMLTWTADQHCVSLGMWGDFDPAPGGGMIASGKATSHPVRRFTSQFRLGAVSKKQTVRCPIRFFAIANHRLP